MRFDPSVSDLRHAFRPEELARVQALPGFDEAARGALANWARPRQEDPALFDAFHDDGRFAAAWLCLGLHHSGGLTQQRLGQAMVETGQSSFGRVRALLLFLLAIGYIRPLPRGRDGRERRYGPTPEMEGAMRRWTRAELAIAAALDPDCARALAALDRPGCFEALACAYSRVRIVLAPVRAEFPRQTLFSTRDGGRALLAHMVLSADAPGAPFPRAGPVTASVAGLARAVGVTRRQVRLVQETAARAGYLERKGEGWALTPALADEVRALSALRVLGMALISREALPRRSAD